MPRISLGEYLDFHVKVGDVVLQARAHPSLRTPTGDPIFVRMRAEKCVAIRTDAAPRGVSARVSDPSSKR